MSEFNENVWPSTRVRETFIKYFEEKRGHTFWKSSPVVPVNDPTLLFANAGMNQYKPLFLGTCDPSLEMSKLKMAVNSQKCIRAGGKHNDLDDVGKDVYHHTFFEMLGNWSFGSYFKEEAITWAWECLTSVYGINPERLYATYFGGDEKQGLAPDEEARQIWLRFLPSSRILPFGCKDNFWEMGATGPCGPCTEIHFDRIGDRDAAALVNADRPDVIEIWNNVFIQFNRESDGTLKELPAKHVDTGMGFERLTSILQGKDSNYDTDIFMPIFAQIQEICKCRPYQGLVGAEDKDLIDMAYRVVADHIRTLTFALTDGAVPSSDGRGYVLRRILRRAVRYGQEILGAPSGFFTALVPIVVSRFSNFFPELATRKEVVMSIIDEEEKSFVRTLDQGVKYFKKVVASMESAGSKVVAGKDAHLLFGSMGFPIDLTELMAAERGFTVDKDGFDALMENDRKLSEAAEAARKGTGSKDLSMEAEQTAWLQGKGLPTTESNDKYIWGMEASTSIIAVFTGRGGSGPGFVDSVTKDEGTVGLILNSSPFYYESGGQVNDTGFIYLSDGSKFTVDNVQTYAGYIVHVGSLEKGTAKVGDSVKAVVDYERRSFIAPNHTMTHVLNYALRTVLIGEGSELTQGLCEQKGSLVDSEKLRFDFSWNGGLSPAQVASVEAIVCDQIKSKLPVYAQVVPLADASQITALRQVFGEKYPDPVRVISVGESIDSLMANPTNPAWRGLSIEFCGGTHLSNTSEAEDFVIYEESGIAKGIRRITGLTRNKAKAARQLASEIISRLETMIKMPGGPELSSLSKAIRFDIDKAVVSLVDKEKMRTLHSKVGDILKAWLKSTIAERLSASIAQTEKLATDAAASKKPIVVTSLDFGADGKLAIKIHDTFKSIHPDGSLFLASVDDDGEKVGVFPIVSANHIAIGLSAKEWCDHVISVVGNGKGGGKADKATASFTGGKDILSTVISSAEEYAKSKI